MKISKPEIIDELSPYSFTDLINIKTIEDGIFNKDDNLDLKPKTQIFFNQKY